MATIRLQLSSCNERLSQYTVHTTHTHTQTDVPEKYDYFIGHYFRSKWPFTEIPLIFGVISFEYRGFTSPIKIVKHWMNLHCKLVLCEVFEGGWGGMSLTVAETVEKMTWKTVLFEKRSINQSVWFKFAIISMLLHYRQIEIQPSHLNIEFGFVLIVPLVSILLRFVFIFSILVSFSIYTLRRMIKCAPFAFSLNYTQMLAYKSEMHKELNENAKEE